MLRIRADLLIPGRGEPIADAVLTADNSVITYAGPAAGAPASGSAEQVDVPVLMPGLWDCHGHFEGSRVPDLAAMALVHPALMGARAATDCTRVLQAGFTSVREPGGVGIHVRHAIDEGVLAGPRIYSAGAILSTTGGHGDLHMYPVAWMRHLMEHEHVLQLCDGVPECLRAVRLQLRQGASFIKICASGGVMSAVDHPIHQQFSAEEMRAIVEEAGRAERIVAAHCHGKPGIIAALEAGCHTIEHGSYLDEECADAMIERDAVLVPTRLVVANLMRGSRIGLPEYARRKIAVLADRHLEALHLAIAKGVRIAAGTDIGLTGLDLPHSWGQNAQELPLLVDAGMTPLQAIEAATAAAPSTLGPQAPRSGQLAVGYDADLLAVKFNPLEDIGLLAKPDNILSVWKAGELAA